MKRRHVHTVAWFMAVAAVSPPALGDLDIRFDYKYDARGFFSGANLGRRQILEAAAAVFEERILNTLPAITPGGINTWTLSFPNPNSGATVTLTDPRVPAGTMTVYVGARSLGSLIGYAEYNYTYFGNAAWVQLFDGKDNQESFSPFGGSIAFDVNTPWFFDETPDTPDAFPGRYDFFSVALHEIGHLLGITAGARAFDALSVDGEFFGLKSQGVFGGPVPLAADGNHWRQEVLLEGMPPSMTPTFFFNQRKTFSELDFAGLADIGYALRPPTADPLIITSVVDEGGRVTVNWQGGTPPFRPQSRTSLSEDSWQDLGPVTMERVVTVETSDETGFMRVLDAGE